MTTELTFRPATRTGVKPLIGLYAESGCGKTYSALLLARGIAGPTGRIAMIDTEAGRGSLYADMLPGGYDVMELPPPFRPQSYMDAIKRAEEAGYDVLVIDSMSHEWEGEGGVLDWAAENEGHGKKGQQVWKDPKMSHNRLVLRLQQSRLAVICCIRGKFKSRQVVQNGRKDIVKDEHLSPIQDEGFIFELTTHAVILPNHTIRVTKEGTPALRACLPKDEQEPISIKHGEAIAKWAVTPAKVSGPQEPAKDGRETAKRALWAVAKAKFADVKEFEQWLWDEGFIDTDSESLAELSASRLEEVTVKVKARLA